MKQGSMVKRTLAALLCLVLVLSFVPGNLFTAYAAEADDTLWKVYGENDTTTKGAWNTAYGTYDAVLLGYNYTGAVTAGSRTVFQGKNFTNMGAYCANGKVSVTLPNTNAEHYTFGVTEEAGTNPPSETLYNPNPAVTAQFDVYYTGGINKIVPGASSLPTLFEDTYVDANSVEQAGWDRVFFTFTGLNENQEYLFRVYTNNNVNGFYKSKGMEDLKVHFVDAEGNVYTNVDAIQSTTFNGGVYRAYKVKGNFTVIFDRRLTYNGKLDRAAAAGYWGPSGFFFDEHAEPEQLPENVFPEALTPWTFTETDASTKGAWNTVGYGSYDAVLLGYNFTGTYGTVNSNGRETVSNVNYITNYASYIYKDKVALSTMSGTEYYTFAATDEDGHNPASEILYNPNTAFAGGVRDVYNTSYTKNGSFTGLEDSGTEWGRQYYTFSGLEEGKYYYFRIYTNNNINGYYKADEQVDLKIHFVEADGTAHKNVEAIESHSFDGGVYRTYLVEGNFTLVVDKKLTKIDGTENNQRSAWYWSPSGFFFDEYEAPLTKVPAEEAETIPAWSQVGTIDNLTGRAWATKGYGEVQALLPGWAFATAENNGVPNGGVVNTDTNSTLAYPHYNGAEVDRYSNHLLRSNTESEITVDLAYMPGRLRAFPGETVEGSNLLRNHLEAPKGYAGVTPQWNIYAGDGYGPTTENLIFNSVVTLTAGYRQAYKFTGLDADKEYVFTIYADTKCLKAGQSGNVQFHFANAEFTAQYGSTYSTTTEAFGTNGGYLSFKVSGVSSFNLVVDKITGRWGPSAFFFDECAVAEELTPPVWKFVDTDTTTKGAWNTTGYGSYDAVLLGYNYTGEVVAGDRKTFNSNQYTYVPNGKVSVSWPFTNEHYTIGSTGETGNNPLEETLYNPNTAVTNKFDVFYTAAFDSAHAVADDVPGYATLGNVETNWRRIYFTFSGLDADQYYLFRMYTNNNIAGYYKADVQDDVKIHLVEASGAVHNVETIQSRSFDGGVYRTYLVKGNFTIVIDKKVTRADGAADNARSAGYWGPSGFFFDEYEAPAQDKVETASITLDGTIGVNYGVNLNLIAKQDEDAYMKLTQGDDIVTVSVADSKWQNKLNWFSKGVAAKEMADIVTAQMYYSDGTTGALNEYSVKQYAEKVLCIETDDAEMLELQTLLVRMLNYGAFAQTYFDYNTGNLANSALSTTAKNSGLSTVLASQLKPYVGKCNVGSGSIQMSYASLLLKSETTLRLSFNKADVQGMTFEYNGNALTPNTRGSYTYVDITNIAAAELDDVFNVVIKNGDTEVSTVTYCPLAYVYSAMTQSDDANLINAVKSLYLYNQAANAYFK